MAVAVLCVAISCTEGTPRGPTGPSPGPAPGGVRWSIGGSIVETLTGMPVAQATLDLGSLGSTTTGADGRFFFERESAPGGGTYPITVRAPGFVTRGVRVTWQSGDRTGLVFDLIRDAQPFSLAFYRELVRDGAEAPGALETLVRWTTAPSFYIRTVDDGGRPVASDVVASVRAAIARGVPEWTGMEAAAIQVGAEARGSVRGWVRVNFVRTSGDFCGRAFVGGNPGVIELTLEGCECGSHQIAPDTVLHEVGHAMGFWHVNDRRSVMYAGGAFSCANPQLSTAEAHHAAIAYRRPVGSRDIDEDPVSAIALETPGIMIED